MHDFGQCGVVSAGLLVLELPVHSERLRVVDLWTFAAFPQYLQHRRYNRRKYKLTEYLVIQSSTIIVPWPYHRTTILNTASPPLVAD